MRRTILGILAALILLATTACTITQKDPGYVPPTPLPALEQLKQAPLADAGAFAAGQDILSFATADHNVVCSLTSARGEHLNLPYEQNGFADTANNKLATVPVAHCELAVYPAPAAQDIADNCGGTGLGYLGGAALLTPEKASYGECRSGLTQQEAAFGPKGSRSGPISQLPVLEDGKNLERNGLRCSAYNNGVACGNVSAGVAFFVSRDHYELISKPAKTASQTPSAAPKTP
jgi:predicted small lipoprotein YifL